MCSTHLEDAEFKLQLSCSYKDWRYY